MLTIVGTNMKVKVVNFLNILLKLFLVLEQKSVTESGSPPPLPVGRTDSFYWKNNFQVH